MTEKMFSLFLILHIAGGSVGLLSGSINLLMKKGGNRHRIIGKIFVYSMLIASFSSLVLSALHLNHFLFTVGIFTLYMVGTGNRYIYLKMLGKSQKPKFLDWSLTIAMLLSVVFFMILGGWLLSNSTYFGLVYLAFGLFGIRFVKEDLDNYRGKFRFKNYWLIAHLSRMTGGYIASLTAFLVVNAKYSSIQLPLIIVWLFPSLVLVPLIILWSKRFGIKKQF